MKIAIVKLSALGDIIHSMIVLQFIKQKYPDAQISWIVDDNFKQILEHNPDIYQIISLKIKAAKQQKSLKLLWNEIKKVRKLSKFDVVIDMQGLLKSAIIAKNIPSKNLVGFDKNSIREKVASYFYQQKVKINYSENTILRNLEIVCSPLNISINTKSIVEKRSFLFSDLEHKIKEDNYIVFIINSTWESRNYPVEKFIYLANQLQKPCYIPWVNLEEYNKAIDMSNKSKFIKILPKLNLNNLISIISNSKLLIGNDTGPTHMAWGLNIPSITIFGPTPENRIFQTPINLSIKSPSLINHYKLNKFDFSIAEVNADKILDMAKFLLKNA